MAMKSGLSGLFAFLLLLLMSVCGLGSVVKKRFTFYGSYYTWSEAQNVCRSLQTDLAVIYSQADADQMNIGSYCAWTGLHRVDGSSSDDDSSSYWLWSDGQFSTYHSWANGEPDNGDNCAVVCYSTERLYGTRCDERHFFMCHKVKPKKDLGYSFVPQAKTWSEARLHCRTEFDDLATFKYRYDLTSNLVKQDFPVWTGLYRDGQTWKWSEGVSTYRRWADAEPGDGGDCVSISSLSKKMATQDCSARFPAVCFKDNLVLVQESKTWEEALEHCRDLGLDLMSVQPGGDHEHVVSRIAQASTEKVWTGLRFLADEWLWVNGADVSHSGLPLCPLGGRRCGVISKKDSGSMETADCLEKLNFLCYSS